MNIIRHYAFIIFLLTVCSLNGTAQELISIGQWRSHFNYQSAQHIAITSDRVYCATTNGLFFIDLDDNSVNRLTKTDGLSDVSISAIGFSSTSQSLIVGYESGTVDIINSEGIFIFSEILNAEITGSKRINHVSTIDDRAFLSTPFGMVVINLVNNEVIESYLNIGPSGERIAVYQSAIDGDTLYLATSMGLISGDIGGTVNLLDFQNWKRISHPDQIANQSVLFVRIEDDSQIAVSFSNKVFRKQADSWEELLDFGEETVVGADLIGSKLYISLSGRLVSYDLLLNSPDDFKYADEMNPAQIAIDEGGTFWIADSKRGLFAGSNGSFEVIEITGPASNDISKLYYSNEQIFALHGGLENGIAKQGGVEGYSIFKGGRWEVVFTDDIPFARYTDITGEGLQNMVATSFGDGLLDIVENIVTNAESPGSSFLNGGIDGDETLLTGAVYDSQGSLWVTNYNNPQPLHRRDVQGNWESFSFNQAQSRFPVSISINDFDDLWMTLDPDEGGGLLVYNGGTNDVRLLTSDPNGGNLPNQRVTEVVFDRSGQAWIGTAAGIAFFPDVENLFVNPESGAIRPIFDNRFLLEDEFITALAVDGGNRKWIGTTEGLWLFDDVGESLVANYRFENSPLPDNFIVDIEVDPRTGEVFITTGSGLVSIRGTATTALSEHLDVKIFPNPVRPGYTGQIGISGLAEDANVKITDIAGRLIREIMANGGTAVWDGRGFRGNSASTGIYLVFSSSDNGDETFVGKIAIVR